MSDEPMRARLKVAKILVVDDQPSNLELLAGLLQENDYTNVRCARSGEQALELLRREPHDLVLLDMRMPGMDGAEFMRRLAGEWTTRAAPRVIVLTAQSDDRTRETALAAGAHDFVTKPFVIWELLHRVESLLTSELMARDAHRTNEILEQRVAERTEALTAANRDMATTLAAAADATQKAEKANRLIRAFMANVSQELRTPLTSIIGFSEAMMSGGLGAAAALRYPEYVRNIHESGRQLLSVVDTLVDFAQLDAGRYELVEEPLAVREYIETCIRELPDTAKRHVRINRELAPNLPPVTADRRLMRLMLKALLDNAVKFTRENGTITVRANRDGQGGLALVVEDTGVGISADDIPLVLEPFGQARGLVRSGERGAGMGLPLASRIAVLHGGVLSIDSTPAVGTAITITFPPDRLLQIPAPSGIAG